MEIERVTISMKKELAVLLTKRAQEQKRSVSNYAAIIIEDDLRAAGLLTSQPPAPELAEFIAKLSAAYAASPRLLARLQVVIVKELRAKKEAA